MKRKDLCFTKISPHILNVHSLSSALLLGKIALFFRLIIAGYPLKKREVKDPIFHKDITISPATCTLFKSVSTVQCLALGTIIWSLWLRFARWEMTRLSKNENLDNQSLHLGRWRKLISQIWVKRIESINISMGEDEGISRSLCVHQNMAVLVTVVQVFDDDCVYCIISKSSL